jgi:hypothetical protein
VAFATVSPFLYAVLAMMQASPRNFEMPRLSPLLAALALATGMAVAPARADFSSYAIVRTDGSMSIAGRLVRLQGIWLPTDDYACAANERPPQCPSRPVMNLTSKIGAEFVRCQELGYDSTGAVLGRCTVLGEDLGGWLVRNGWAMAGPDAPMEYRQWERLAESRRLGIWGPSLNGIIVQPHPRRR